MSTQNIGIKLLLLLLLLSWTTLNWSCLHEANEVFFVWNERKRTTFAVSVATVTLHRTVCFFAGLHWR